MYKFNTLHALYKNMLRPYLFSLDCEEADNKIISVFESLEDNEWFLENMYAYKNDKLKKSLLGIDFENPIGLGAGLDYDGHLSKALKHIGFGFNTIGSVTAKSYAGNPIPRLTRLVKSKAILVNKGFKSDGAVTVAKRLDKKNFTDNVIGISVGNSNIPSVDTLNKAIDDYLFTFDLFSKKSYVKYFELNISCPNITIREAFKNTQNVANLIKAVRKLKVRQPIFMKMHNEVDLPESDEIVKTGLANGINGYIFSNLIGNRQNKALNKKEVAGIVGMKGGISGKPTSEGANLLLRHTREKFGKDVVLVGCGGVFDAKDAIEKFKNGADLVQLVTGFIFEGPQIAGDINYNLAKLNRF